METNYVHGSAIFLEFAKSYSNNQDVKVTVAAVENSANKTWQRLQNGEPFAKVAEGVSEDKVSAARGGQLGFVRTDTIDIEVSEAWKKLEPGKFSKPIRTSWGYIIIMRDKFTEDDVISFIKDQMLKAAKEKACQEYEAAKTQAIIKHVPDNGQVP